ncbi:MAG: HD domain-containing phosphohydrolase [Thermodesulfobacteriota bacterium]
MAKINSENINLNQTFNASKDLQAIIDSDYTIQQINLSYLGYLGITREQAINSKCHEILAGKLCGTRQCPLKQVVDNNKIVEIEITKKGSNNVVTPFLMTATPLYDNDSRVIGMITSFKNIVKIKKSEHRLNKVFQGVLYSMAKIVETRDPYTAGHQERVAKIAGKIAMEMNLSPKKIEAIKISAVLHDIGKIFVPPEFLTKPIVLSNIEFEIIKNHCQKGYDILKSIPFDYPIAKIVLQHHERIDGSGYPNGLKGDSILLEARIISVADVVEAISSNRPYRQSLGMETAFKEIEKYKNIKYDADVVEACLKIQKEIS